MKTTPEEIKEITSELRELAAGSRPYAEMGCSNPCAEPYTSALKAKMLLADVQAGFPLNLREARYTLACARGEYVPIA